MVSHLLEVMESFGMWLVIACAGTAVLSYCLGCLNGAVTVSRCVLKDDIRQHGSGNGGLTNFCRTYGGWLSVVVILCDVLKAVASVAFAVWLFGRMSPELVVFGKYWAGLFCLLGHMFPCNYQFRGGKGVLSGGTIALMIDWRVALVVWGGFIILAVLTKYVSLGSCWAGLTFPIATWFVYGDSLLLGMGIVMGGLLLFQHRGNIKRLVTGTESKFTMKKSAPAPKPEEETPPPVEEAPVEAEAQPMEEEAAE